MKRRNNSRTRAEPDDSWDDDLDSIRSEFFSDAYDDDGEFSFEEIPQVVRRAGKRRVEARRAIERMNEQIALNKYLKDIDDFLI